MHRLPTTEQRNWRNLLECTKEYFKTSFERKGTLLIFHPQRIKKVVLHEV